MKFNLLVPILILAIFSLNYSDRRSDKLNRETSVLLINGEAIQLGEFLLVAKQIKIDVFTLFEKQVNGLDAFEEIKFWNSSFNGITPFEKLKQETGKHLIRIKTEQWLAEKYKIIQKFNYSDFILNLEQENIRRFNAVKNKKPVYGPVQYSEEFYYSYLYNNMVIKLKDILGNQVFKFTDNQYKEYYEINKDIHYRRSSAKGSLLVHGEILQDFKPFDEVKEQIRYSLIDEEYEKLIDIYSSTAELKETDNPVSRNINDDSLIGLMYN